MKVTSKACVFLCLALVFSLLSSCGKRENPNDYPVSHWLNDPDSCVRNTAAAIIASGRPWPNETLNEKHQLVKFDFWIGNQLYELPAEVPLIRNEFLPRAHPLRYSAVSGHAETFLGIPKDKWLKFTQPGIGGTLYGNVHCDNNLPPSEWIEARAIYAPTRSEAIALALDRAREKQQNDPKHILRVEINQRSDIGMTEVRTYTSPPELAGASYFPIDLDLTQNIDGKRAVKSVACAVHDSAAPLNTAAQCRSWIYLGPGLWIEFGAYQQMLPVMPALHNKLLNTFEQSRRK